MCLNKTFVYHLCQITFWQKTIIKYERVRLQRFTNQAGQTNIHFLIFYQHHARFKSQSKNYQSVVSGFTFNDDLDQNKTTKWRILFSFALTWMSWSCFTIQLNVLQCPSIRPISLSCCITALSFYLQTSQRSLRGQRSRLQQQQHLWKTDSITCAE